MQYLERCHMKNLFMVGVGFKLNWVSSFTTPRPRVPRKKREPSGRFPLAWVFSSGCRLFTPPLSKPSTPSRSCLKAPFPSRELGGSWGKKSPSLHCLLQGQGG